MKSRAAQINEQKIHLFKFRVLGQNDKGRGPPYQRAILEKNEKEARKQFFKEFKKRKEIVTIESIEEI